MSNPQQIHVPKINLAFLWHQHQPFYKNENEFLLPWVRFHGTKDYYDMVRILDDFPKIKQNINLVPSLLIQLDEYIDGTIKDKIWILSAKDPNDLSEEDKAEILENFFKCYSERMIKPYPRYLELYRIRGEKYIKKNYPEVKDKFTYQDWFDLQVWYNMVWIGEYSKYDQPYKRVFEKGKNFDIVDKNIILIESKNILKKIIDKHKEVQEQGQIEISFSPFYHPILPLICDSNVGKISSPDIKLPSHRFKHSEDAFNQIKKSIDYYKNIIGKKLIGMWPSEGSLSPEVLSIMAKNGIKWTATDEVVLYNSVKASNDHHIIYRPYDYRTPNGNIKIVFRDHSLSDLIGFVYQGWGTDDAAKDLINRIHNIRESILKNKGEQALNNSLISIILDGENCWEYYQSDGKDFLRTLYWLLSQDDKITTTTIGEFVMGKSPVQKFPRAEKLKSFFPGSWINGNFKIWIGHDEDNKAWDLITETRNFLAKAEKNKKYSKKKINEAWEKIYIAEGSDWNWWYGDEHPTDEIDKFDQLFRKQLMMVYRLLGAKIPEKLNKSIKTSYERISVIYPDKFITPTIDGKKTSFREWEKSGLFIPASAGGSMHRISTLIKEIYFGYDYDNLFLRMDTGPDVPADYNFIIHFIEPFEIDLDIRPVGFGISWKKDTRVNLFRYNFSAAFKDFLEISLARKDFNLVENSFVSFEILIFQNGKEIERLPKHDLIRFKLESESDLRNKRRRLLTPGKES
jgi:alpha-amylase/alpha-mannosidase (GH57 family)